MSPFPESGPYRGGVPPSAVAGFDALHKWLGIPPEEQSPTHYRLLGLRDFEDDPDVISEAADRQMAHLRTHQMGQHAEECQALLNQISTVRVCLLNPAKKTAYDNQLRARTAQSAVAEPPPAVEPPPALDFLQQTERGAGDRVDRREAPSQVSRWVRRHTAVVVGGAATAVVAGVAILFMAGGDKRERSSGPSKPAATKKLPAQAPEVSKPVAVPPRPGGEVGGDSSVEKTVVGVREEVKEKVADPFRDCPIVVDLPLPGDPGERELAKIYTGADTPWELTLEGDTQWELMFMGISGKGKLIMERKDEGEKQTWKVRSVPPGGDSSSPLIAKFTRDGQSLRFQWGDLGPLGSPSPFVASHLYGCKLKIRVGNEERLLSLPPRGEISGFMSQGEISGIGVTVEQRSGVLTITAPLPGSPAEKSGLKSGDEILAVDGVNIVGLPYAEASEKPRGPKGSVARLRIRRNGTEFDVKITRDTIKVPDKAPEEPLERPKPAESPKPAEPPAEEKGTEAPVKPAFRPAPPRRLPAKKEIQEEGITLNLLEQFAKMNEREFAACITRGKVQLRRATADTPAHMQLGPSPISHIYLPVKKKIEGKYRYSVSFARVTGVDAVEVDFPVGSSMTTMVLSGWNGEAGGLSRVNGLEPIDNRNPTKITPCQLVNNMRYQIDIEVVPLQRLKDDELVDVAVFLHDETGRSLGVCRYSGKTSLLTMHQSRVQEQQGFGIASWNDANRVLVYSAVVQPIKTPVVRGAKSSRR